jgi:hypothetical protein
MIPAIFIQFKMGVNCRYFWYIYDFIANVMPPLVITKGLLAFLCNRLHLIF